MIYSHLSLAGEIVFQMQGLSFDQRPCQFTMVKKNDGTYRLTSEEEVFFLFSKSLQYDFSAKKVEALLANRKADDSIMIKQDYGTPSREAFTRFELNFSGNRLNEVNALKYKNLNYKTKSTFLSCKK